MTNLADKRPRGVRNNNPGNIRHSSANWQGKAVEQPDKAFVTFKEPRHGIRAMAVTLITYFDKRKAADGTAIDTIEDVVKRWAPPNENDTLSYIRAVDRSHPKALDEELDLHDYDDLYPLVVALIAHENAGYKYPKAVVDAGLRLAGVEPKVKASRSAEAVGGMVGGAGLSGQFFVESAQQMHAMGPEGSATLQWFMMALMAVGFGISVFGLYRRWKLQGVA